MKGFDFTQTGGFPLTQDVLGYLQEGYTEAVRALAAIGGNTAGPMVISGMEVTEPSPGEVAVTNGWFMYNGDLIQFTGGMVTPIGGDVALVSITVSETPLVFFDGLTHNVKHNKTATLTTDVSVTDTTHFPLADIHPFGREREWININDTHVPPANIDVDIWYKKDFLTNTLLLRGMMGLISVSPPDSLPTPSYYESIQFPEGYRPRHVVPFIVANDSVTIPLDDTGNDYIRHINAKLLTDGKLLIEWITYGGGPPYNIFFNVRLSLD